MASVTALSCRCGKVRLSVEADPILAVECECDSCRKGSAYLAGLPGAESIVEPTGGTHYVLYRKDRVTFMAGAENFRSYRLTGKSATRRVVAACCNTPIFVEFQHGHWLSLYAGLWPQQGRPPATMRTMTSDLPPGAALPDDIPNHKTQSPGFFVKLLAAWVAMGFRTPKIDVPSEKVIETSA